MEKHMSKKITAMIVGAGHRSLLYGQYALHHPEEFQIVGVADPDPLRRSKAAKMFDIPEERCFESAMELAKEPKLADAVINGTMDNQHVETAVPLLQKGYDMLLEKPFAINEDEMWRLYKAAKETGRRVMICHVLRYAPFYRAVKEAVTAGEIGDIINMYATEHVSYHHLSAAYVRGKWNNCKKCGATMLLAKCCHDLDILIWLKSGIAPRYVTSFGSDFRFTSDKRPKGAGSRCLTDCPVERECDYSARKLCIEHPDRWGFYVWDSLAHLGEPSIEEKIKSLSTDNPYGLCAWNCGHENVDHQSVMLSFADGATATLHMVGGAAKAERNLHIVGTKGEIKGIFDDSFYDLRKIDHQAERGWNEKRIDLGIGGDKSGLTGSHGGGDLRLVEDFVHVLQGEQPSISYTGIEDSIHGHLAVFLADRARETLQVQEFPAVMG